MFLDVGSLLIITLPLFLPIIKSLGFDPIWFCVLACMMSEIATVTPPVGLNVYVVHGVAPHVPLMSIFLGVWRFLVVNLVTVAIVLIYPQLALFLVERMM